MAASSGAVEVDRTAPGDEPSEHVCGQCEGTGGGKCSESMSKDVHLNACPICLEDVNWMSMEDCRVEALDEWLEPAAEDDVLSMLSLSHREPL